MKNFVWFIWFQINQNTFSEHESRCLRIHSDVIEFLCQLFSFSEISCDYFVFWRVEKKLWLFIDIFHYGVQCFVLFDYLNFLRNHIEVIDFNENYSILQIFGKWSVCDLILNPEISCVISGAETQNLQFRLIYRRVSLQKTSENLSDRLYARPGASVDNGKHLFFRFQKKVRIIIFEIAEARSVTKEYISI